MQLYFIQYTMLQFNLHYYDVSSFFVDLEHDMLTISSFLASLKVFEMAPRPFWQKTVDIVGSAWRDGEWWGAVRAYMHVL